MINNQRNYIVRKEMEEAIAFLMLDLDDKVDALNSIYEEEGVSLRFTTVTRNVADDKMITHNVLNGLYMKIKEPYKLKGETLT